MGLGAAGQRRRPKAHAYIHTYMHTFIHAYMHMHLQSFTHAYIQTYIITHVYTGVVIAWDWALPRRCDTKALGADQDKDHTQEFSSQKNDFDLSVLSSILLAYTHM